LLREDGQFITAEDDVRGSGWRGGEKRFDAVGHGNSGRFFVPDEYLLLVRQENSGDAHDQNDQAGKNAGDQVQPEESFANHSLCLALRPTSEADCDKRRLTARLMGDREPRRRGVG
jgi:hypothetical protein